MIQQCIHTWSDYGFEIILGTCILFLIIYGLYRWCSGARGAWYNDTQYYNYLGTAINQKDGRTPTISSSPISSSPSSQGGDSKGERECRRVLQQLFNRPFDKARPNFLANPVTGGSRNLELDCYDESLNLACEYNGEQHYKFIPYFHRTKDAFYNQKYRDQFKKKTCEERGVRLIEVPYNIKVPDIESYIMTELTRLGITY